MKTGPKARKPSARQVLADGVALDSLINLEDREIAQRVFADQEIYQLELERIWSKAWIVVGHESEIKEPGDFVTRRIGDDNIILTRQKDGEIVGLLNNCAHRGAAVCRSEAGNTPAFRCIYHGWTYNLDGSFRGAPFANLMYSEGMDRSKMGLRRARICVFCGIIFCCWDERAPSLREFLGDFSWYLNLIYNRSERGLEVIGPPQRFIVNANWKTASEQFACDAWHACNLHRSLEVFMLSEDGATARDPKVWQLYAPKVGTELGHSIICFDFPDLPIPDGGCELSPLEKLMAVPPPGLPREFVGELTGRFTEQEIRLLSKNPPTNGGMFPNVGIWSMNSIHLDGRPSGFLSIRTHVPVGVDKFEFCMWVLATRDAPEGLRERMRIACSFTQGASGFVEEDDAAVWPGMTLGGRGYIGRQNTLKYWALSGHNPPEDWPGGGNVYTGFSKDDTQWNWWMRYFAYLQNKV